jgi:hypothetical protein
MLWEEIEVSRAPHDDALLCALSSVFGVSPGAVAIVESLEDAAAVDDPSITILVERWRQGGEFPLHVRVYLRGPDPRAAVSDQEASLGYVKRLSHELDSTCLIADGSVNPYSMLLVRPTGDVTTVLLDSDALERDEYVIAVPVLRVR